MAQTTAANVYEKSYTLYDYKARPISSKITNFLGGYTQTDTKLDFMGKTLYTITKHKRDSNTAELLIKDEFTYTDQDRLLTQTHQINSLAKQLIVSNTYDELGKLTSKKVGGTDVTGSIGLQKVDYAYNIRGWLTDINNANNLTQIGDPQDLFAFKINYNAPSTAIALFNGNISETLWRTKSDNQLRKYEYSYDNLNRLLDAVYQKPDDSFFNNKSYDESLNYDKNGNIIGLQRYGGYETDGSSPAVLIDELDYNYAVNSNQLQAVTDSSASPEGFNDGSTIGNDYGYDDNGNMIVDTNKNIIKITYNHLNLPTKIEFAQSRTIEYLYNALGIKIAKKVKYIKQVGVPCAGGASFRGAANQINSCTTNVPTTDVTLYLQGGYQYLNDVLQFFPHAEGYVKPIKNDFAYVFNYTDHLGNVRLSYQDIDKNGTLGHEKIVVSGGGLANGYIDYISPIIEENHYYPFGLKHEGYNYTYSTGNNYKYNGKELQDELGLNVYDYDNRIYDPAYGRFWEIDPKGELGRKWSPYNYCFDNPIYFQDPDGMWPENPFAGLINKAKQIVNNYVSSKVERVVSLAKAYVKEKADNLLKAITPNISNPFTKAEPDKANKSNSNGVTFTTDGGKEGAMATTVTTGDTKKVDMSVVVGLTDVYGPPTNVPGVAPDGSNPFTKEGSSEATSESTISSDNTATDKIEISIPKSHFDAGPNSKSANHHYKDTIVNKVDSAKVVNNAKTKQNEDTKSFNKKHGTNF